MQKKWDDRDLAIALAVEFDWATVEEIGRRARIESRGNGWTTRVRNRLDAMVKTGYVECFTSAIDGKHYRRVSDMRVEI
jgi:hypothetical protein